MACAEVLQGIASSTVSFTAPAFGDCDGTFAAMCGLVEVAGCDVTGATFLALAGCLAEAILGCPGFSTCDDYDAASDTNDDDDDAVVSVAPTSTSSDVLFPTGAETSAPTTSRTSAPSDVEALADETPTLAPTVAVEDGTPVPTASESTPAPGTSEPDEAGTALNVGFKLTTAAVTTTIILSAVVSVVMSACFDT